MPFQFVDPEHISTSFVERQNLTMRMVMRRFTRLTNGFSKKLENHGHAVALHYMHYNFCRVTQKFEGDPRHGSWDYRPRVELRGASRFTVSGMLGSLETHGHLACTLALF